MTFPNLVIGGAPKCGTSSLFNWLADHPQACGSSIKESFFLMDEDNPLRRRDCNFRDHGLDAYAGFFRNCAERHEVVLEATTHYLYQQTALEVLASLPTRPRLLFVLRKPSERLFSSFAYSKNNLGHVRADLSFAEFADRITSGSAEYSPDRAFGPSAYVLARDFQYSCYVDYLTLWRDRLGKERVRILLFEAMRADPRAAIQDLCRWLGIDPSFYDNYDFTPRNRTVAVRSGRLQLIARAVGRRAPAGFLKNFLKGLYGSLQAKAVEEERSADDCAALARLDEKFRPFNDRLARDFGLDLRAWD